MKRIWIIALALALLCAACPAHAVEPDDAALIDNWYEIFVASYADGDGDRMGDFKGLTQKLPYIHDMGFRGVWLMPIHPSPTYHKYDVTDYYAIDPDYGTMEDFDLFLEEAHQLGIRVILDLVVNHTSNEHPWFQSAKSDPASPYRSYYNFYDEQRAGCNQLPDGTWFESRFVSTMPDLNLDHPAVREEIESIMAFWLNKGVDGFRLDAVTSYYTGDKTGNIEFLRWLNDTAKAIRPDCVIIGECWEDMYTISDYYASGADSFFLFPVSQSGGYIAKILSNDVEKKGYSFGNVVSLLEREFEGRWMTPFLGNHDTNRIASVVGAYNPTNVKMAAGLLALMRGSVFVYYGDEIGMTGTGNDPNKRIGMYWDQKKYITRCPVGTTVAEYPFPSVEKQQHNELSILTYYRNAMQLRLHHPEIARGTSAILPSENDQVCMLVRTWGETQTLIILNMSIDDMAVNVPDGYDEVIGELEIWGQASYAEGVVTVPAYGIVLMN